MTSIQIEVLQISQMGSYLGSVLGAILLFQHIGGFGPEKKWLTGKNPAPRPRPKPAL